MPMKNTTPDREGFYWAKWRIADEDTHEGDELTPSNKWEVVEVWENTNGEGAERFLVHVPGVRESQRLENFFWGPIVPQYRGN